MTKTIKRSDFVPKKKEELKIGATGKQVATLKKYLLLFGYLNPQDVTYEELDLPPEPEDDSDAALLPIASTVKSDVFDEATKEALQGFQKFHDIDLTGTLDKATLEAMGSPRCGFPDGPDIGEFTADSRKWSKTEITYGFLNYSPELTAGQTRQAIEQAFALWAAEIPQRFRRINNANSADIRIRFVAGDHGDGSAFDGRSGVLAHAFYPPPNSGDLAGDAHFDEAETWTITVPPGAGKIDLVTVAAHEFGHSLGLRHSSVNGSLMFPSYGGPHRFLHSDDVNGIKSKYGSYSIDQAPWIHGTSIQVEYPDRLHSIRRLGFYSRIYGKQNTTNWFHFAVPAPVIVSGKRLRIARAMLRCRTASTKAIIKHVHLYDGYSKIASHNDINLTGNQWFVKFGVAHKPYVYWGLGISIGVEFKNGTVAQRRMDFASAGFDLVK